MQNNQILAVLKKNIGTMALFGVLVAALSFAVLTMKEKNFKVGTDYLIVQNQASTQDFYTLSKSAEYIGKILNEGIYSELFIDEVVKTGKVNAEFLPFDKKEKLKSWSNTVAVGLNPDLGIISVRVFDNDQKQALAISQAVAVVLTTKSNLFYGEGQNINVKILSGPVLEKNPSMGNIAAASIGGFVLGMMLGAFWIVSKESRRKRDSFSHSSEAMSSSSVISKPSVEDQMEMGGNFMSEEEYMESIRNMDGR